MNRARRPFRNIRRLTSTLLAALSRPEQTHGLVPSKRLNAGGDDHHAADRVVATSTRRAALMQSLWPVVLTLWVTADSSNPSVASTR